MKFIFHMADGYQIVSHSRTASVALRSLRRMAGVGQQPRISLQDVVLCSITEDWFEDSPTNAEMERAGHTVVNYFWQKLRQGVDAEIHVLPNN